VTMWIDPAEVGYTLVCNGTQFDGLGDNPLQNTVDQIALLEYFLEDGGTTWELPNATASNAEVCWVAMPSDEQSITVPVLEDVTAGPRWPDSVFPDVNDLAVEAGDGEAYLKFEVPPIDGKITRARLFMRTSTAPSSDGDGGEVHVVTDNEWSEATMTGNTRPAYEAASLGRIGPAAADILLSLDLGTAVAGPGTHGFAVVSPPTDGNGTHFWSKEGSASGAAYLKIDYVVMDVDDDCDGETDEGCDTGDAGDGSSGGSSGSEGSEGADAASEAGSGLPGGGTGLRGADTGCGCTTPGGTSPTWLIVAFAVLRRRRVCQPPGHTT